MHFKKSIISDFIFLVIIQSIYFFPLIIIGLDRIEDYQYNHFSALILAKNSFSPFIFFYDLIGPGTRLPLVSGLNYFFPPAIFIIFHVILSINSQYKDLKDQEYNFFNTNKEYKQTVFYEKTNSIYNEELNFSKTY